MFLLGKEKETSRLQKAAAAAALKIGCKSGRNRRFQVGCLLENIKKLRDLKRYPSFPIF